MDVTKDVPLEKSKRSRSRHCDKLLTQRAIDMYSLTLIIFSQACMAMNSSTQFVRAGLATT